MKDIKTFWTRVFGIKVGDIIRVKYGKVYWEVWDIRPSAMKGGRIVFKVRRFVKHRWGVLGDIANEEFLQETIVEVHDKKDMVESFPSVLFR